MLRRTSEERGSRDLSLAHHRHSHRALIVDRTGEVRLRCLAMLHLVQTPTTTNVAANLIIARWVHRMQSRAMGVSTPQIPHPGLGSPTVQVVVVETSRRLPVLV